MQPKPWPVALEELRKPGSGIVAIGTYMSVDGNNICQFHWPDGMITHSSSWVSMQEAVDKCIAELELERSAIEFAKNPEIKIIG